ncbi:MAG: hypothetical protein FJ224_02155 [Lentisphaerae bacterium]|nr:hypothetical protein [Lentisphaerota bacterium]
MKLTRREATLGVATLAVCLFGGTAILARPNLERWKALRSEQRAARETIAEYEGLIAEAPGWQAKFDELSSKLVARPASGRTDVFWLSEIDRVASMHGLNIPRRQALDERAMGEIFELPVECQWEGTLSSLVHFLFDLQTRGVMFDVRQLLVKPVGKDQLRGRFVVHCAYRREKSPSAAGSTAGANP